MLERVSDVQKRRQYSHTGRTSVLVEKWPDDAGRKSRIDCSAGTSWSLLSGKLMPSAKLEMAALSDCLDIDPPNRAGEFVGQF